MDASLSDSRWSQAQDDLRDEPNSFIPGTLRWVVSSDFWHYDRTERTLFVPDGHVCQYDVDGWLSRCSDAFGNDVTLTWTPGSLSVVQELGNDPPREVVLTLHEATRLPLTMTFAGRTWEYEYTDLAPTSSLRMTQARAPIGPAWQYDYDSSGVLSFVKSPHGAEIRYTHEILHQGFLTRAVTRRSTAGVRSVEPGEWTYEYDFSDSRVSGATAILTPSGTRHTYLHGTLLTGSSIVDGNSGLTYRFVEIPQGQGWFELEREERHYQGVAVHTYPNRTWSTPELLTSTLTRSGRSYVTQLGFSSENFGDYHQPSSIVETGELSRQILRTYRPTTAFIVGQVETEQVLAGTESFAKSWEYDSSTGFMTSATIYGLTTDFAPDEFGNVASVEQPNGKTTSFAYSYGAQSRVQTPEHTTTRVINPDGTVASETQAGRTTEFPLYDELSRIRRTEPPGGTNAIVTEYDNTAGEWFKVSRGSAQPDTSFLTTTLDGFGRPIGPENSVGVKTTVQYDAEGQRTYDDYPFVPGVGAGDIGSSLTYDRLGRLIRKTNPGGTYSQRTYGAGTLTIRDENDNQAVQMLESFGNPDVARLAAVTDADQKLWQYTYNGLGQLKRVTAPDAIIRSWEYLLGSNLLSSETHPESGTTTYSYTDGVMTGKSDARGTAFVYTHDGNDRLIAETAGGRLTTIAYEPGSDNRRVTRNGAAAVELQYDSSGRPSTRIDNISGRIWTSAYEYDANDNLTVLSYPVLNGATSRRRVTFEYDSERRTRRVFEGTTSYASNLQYHSSGALTQYTAGNGLTTTLEYDLQRYLPTSIGAGSMSFTYQDYDGVGNVQSIVDSRPGMNQSFTYDPLDRLEFASGPYGPITYAYDVHGNRQTVSGSTTYTYEPGKLRLKTQDASTFGYDASGNLETAPNATYTYTPRNMLESAMVIGGTTTYAYDADEWRVKKGAPGETTYYLRSLDQQVLTEWINPGPSGQTRDYIYAGSRLIAAVKRSSSVDVTDLYGIIAPGGPPVSMTLTAPNQRAWLSFEATAGQRVSLIGTATNVTSTSGLALLWAPLSIVRASDGFTVTGGLVSSSTAYRDAVTLTEPGTYFVLIDPYQASIGTATMTLFDVVDPTDQIAINGPAKSMIFSTPGQKGRLTFAAEAGQRVGIVGRSANLPNETLALLYYPLAIIKPNGDVLRANTFTDVSVVFEPLVLPDAGTYTMLIDPYGSTTGTATVTLLQVDDLTGTIEIGGSAVTAQLTVPSQKARFSFTGAAGQRVSLVGSSSNVTTQWHIPALWWPLGIVKPDGVNLKTVTDDGTTLLEPVILPVQGTYTVLVDPFLTSIGTATLNLYECDDFAGSLTVNGGAVPVSLPTPGQKGTLTFEGVVGQQVTVRLTGNTIGSTYVRLMRPDGTQLTSNPSGSSSFTLTPQTLAVPGTYTVIVDPFDTKTGNINVAVTNP